MATFPLSVLTFDYSLASLVSGFYLLYDMTGYTNIDIQCSWTNINGTDSYFKYCEKNAASLNWDEKGQAIAVTTSDDSREINITGFKSKFVGVFIEKGSVSSGKLVIYINAT